MLEAANEVRTKFVDDHEWIIEFIFVIPFSSVTFRCSVVGEP